MQKSVFIRLNLRLDILLSRIINKMELMQINPVFHSLGGYHSCIIRNNPPEQLRYVDAYSILDKIKARRLQPVSCQMSSPKLDAVTKDVLMEDGKDDVHSADDPRYEGNLTYIYIRVSYLSLSLSRVPGASRRVGGDAFRSASRRVAALP